MLIEYDVKEYERKFKEALIKAKDMGVTMCVFGDIDIDIELHKKWNVDRCKNAGIKAELPLWQ